jgi:hypothetical protein
MGFYNFSQESVNYSAFTVDTGSFPPPNPNGSVPDSGSSLALPVLALGGLFFGRRRLAARL